MAEAHRGQARPRQGRDLADIVDLMLATGARIGEVLALRWDDLDLTAPKPTLAIAGTLVQLRGRGLYRQAWPKSAAGHHAVVLPRFAVATLLERKLTADANPHDAIFASRRGTWLSPSNVRRQWRRARQDTDLTWVTPHTFRKTVATLIDRERDSKTAAAQLGHATDSPTKRHYIERPAIAPDVSDVLQVLSDESQQP